MCYIVFYSITFVLYFNCIELYSSVLFSYSIAINAHEDPLVVDIAPVDAPVPPVVLHVLRAVLSMHYQSVSIKIFKFTLGHHHYYFLKL